MTSQLNSRSDESNSTLSQCNELRLSSWWAYKGDCVHSWQGSSLKNLGMAVLIYYAVHEDMYMQCILKLKHACHINRKNQICMSWTCSLDVVKALLVWSESRSTLGQHIQVLWLTLELLPRILTEVYLCLLQSRLCWEVGYLLPEPASRSVCTFLQ